MPPLRWIVKIKACIIFVIKENIMNYSQDGATNSCFNMLSVLQNTENRKRKESKETQIQQTSTFWGSNSEAASGCQMPLSREELWIEKTPVRGRTWTRLTVKLPAQRSQWTRTGCKVTGPTLPLAPVCCTTRILNTRRRTESHAKSYDSTGFWTEAPRGGTEGNQGTMESLDAVWKDRN